MTEEEAVAILISQRDEDPFIPTEYRIQIHEALDMGIKALKQKPKIGYCKDCRWWKDSDGVYRRDLFAESQCPMNRKEVYEGRGYCYMFKPRESEE